jgi:hypothetical protein
MVNAEYALVTVEAWIAAGVQAWCEDLWARERL